MSSLFIPRKGMINQGAKDVVKEEEKQCAKQ